MKPVDKLIPDVLPKAEASGERARGRNVASSGGGSVSGPNDRGANTSRANSGAGTRDHVDAINQLFTEFELAYHNQFHKAYAQDGSLNLAKKYWLTCLGDFTPEVILRAARQVVRSQEYLPTVAAVVAACENALPLFGLPPAHAAYVEACCAPEPKSRHAWSHPAVYLAAKTTGWFALSTEPQSEIFPVFEYNYHQLCQRVLRGEALDVNVPVALSESLPQPLSPEQNKMKMKELRKKFDL